MQNGRLWLLIILCVAVAVTLQIVMNSVTAWSVETKASVWVALGTGLLALTSAWATLETGAVIRAEERRQRQGLAPILKVLPRIQDGIVTGFEVINLGLGPARQLSLVVTGSYEDHVGQRGHETEMRLVEEMIKCSAVGLGEPEHVKLATLGIPEKMLGKLKLEMTYCDLFENVYRTTYNRGDRSALFTYETPKGLWSS